MEKGSEFSVYFVRDEAGSEHAHTDVQFMFVVDGCIQMRVQDETYVLKKDDLLMINSNFRHSWIQIEKSQLFIIHLSYGHLLKFLRNRFIFFYCNSAAESGEKYDKLRNIINQLISEYAVSKDGPSLLAYSYLYQLEDYIAHYFMPADIRSVEKEDGAGRLEQMLQYINANYYRKITLQEMADFMYMIPSSFSRFFKKKMGINFIKYLNHVRIQFALEDVLYTGKAISEIAAQHGFSNPSAFTEAFSKIYKMTPLAYRKYMSSVPAVASEPGHTDIQQTKVAAGGSSIFPNSVNTCAIHADVKQFTVFNNIWTTAVSLGYAQNIQIADMQRQIIMAHKALGFSYGRIYGIFSERMHLRPEQGMHIVNYQPLDTIFDFLFEQGIIPFIYLENKPETIPRAPFKYVVKRQSEIIFNTIQECLSILDDFLGHVIARYGKSWVEQWIFEIWYNEGDENTLGISGSFFNHFTSIYQRIRRYLSTARIGGCGFGGGGTHNEKFRDFMLSWSAQPVAPDFISVSLFPYLPMGSEGRSYSKRMLLRSYYLEHFSLTNDMLSKTGWGHVPLYTTEWNLSLSQRNCFNDSCGKAALMLRQMCMLSNQLPFAAYMELSDFTAVYHDSDKMLIGGGGLLTRTGIAKPAFWALKFMHMMDAYMIGFGENYLLTTDNNNKYTLLAFNYKELKYDYYINEEDAPEPGDMSEIFEDAVPLEMTFILNHIENGIYQLYEYGVSPEQGSVFEACRRLGDAKRLSLDNMGYLEHICIPYQRNSHQSTVNGCLEIKTVLKAQEIHLITILK